MSNEWVNVETDLPKGNEERKVIALFKQDNSGWCGMPLDLHERTHKVWWVPQRECFAYMDIENANHLVSHWFDIPSIPDATQKSGE